MFRHLRNISIRVTDPSYVLKPSWNAALASLLISYVKGDLLYQLMRLDQNDGMTMLRKIQSICVPCTPQDLNNIQMRLWNLKMKEDETAIKFLF